MKLSIITASYNSAATIRETLESVSDQEYRNIEHIVVDGGSTDETIEIIQQFSEKKVIVISEPDNGIYDAFNKGIKMATGDIIGFVHSNDRLIDKNVITNVVNKFSSDAVEAVYGGLLYIDVSKGRKVVRKWRPEAISKTGLFFGQMPPHPTLFFRSDVYARLGFYDTNFKIASDYDFILRYFNNQTGKAVCLNQYLYEMKIGGISNAGIGNQLRKIYEEYLIIRSHKMNALVTIVSKKLRKIKQLW